MRIRDWSSYVCSSDLPRGAQSPVEFEHEEQVRELAHLVTRPIVIAARRRQVAVIHRAALVRDAARDHDAIVDMAMDEPGESEGAEVIDPELQLETLFGERAGRDHHAEIGRAHV